MTTELLNKINEKLSPVRVLKVQDWMEIADVLSEIDIRIMGDRAKNPITNDLNSYRASYKYWRTVSQLQSRCETLTSARLEKGHFVCEVEKKKCRCQCHTNKAIKHIEACCENGYVVNPLEEMQAQEKVWFAGFEAYYQNSVRHSNNGFTLEWDADLMIYTSMDFSMKLPLTVFDFIYHITKYNETATSKIEIQFTEQFVKALVL